MTPLPSPLGNKERKPKGKLPSIHGEVFPGDVAPKPFFSFFSSTSLPAIHTEVFPDDPPASGSADDVLFPNVKKLAHETRDSSPTPAADPAKNKGARADMVWEEQGQNAGKKSSMPAPFLSFVFQGATPPKQDASKGASVPAPLPLPKETKAETPFSLLKRKREEFTDDESPAYETLNVRKTGIDPFSAALKLIKETRNATLARTATNLSRAAAVEQDKDNKPPVVYRENLTSLDLSGRHVRKPRRSRTERMREIASHRASIAEHHNALKNLYMEEADRLEEDSDLE